MKKERLRIQRVQITIGSKFWDEETEDSTEMICEDYDISPEQIISVVSDDGGVWLYWWTKYTK